MKNKGITLIALIITIIVLLILVSITVVTLTGENGIIANARWAEFVTEYESVDEAKKLYVTDKMIDQYIEGGKHYTEYPIDIEQKLQIEDASNTLQKSICYVENMEISDITNEEKVNLYKVDFSLLTGIEVKREYVINIVTGMLYSIPGEEYQGKIYHTPRDGVINDKNDEDDPSELNIRIHYLSGYDDSEYTQDVTQTPENITLEPVRFERSNYTFVYWRDVTSTKNSEDIKDGGDSEETIEFVKQTGGYYDIVNNLINILGEEWEGDILDIIENDKDYDPELEDDETENVAEDVATKTKNDILEYLEDVKEEIKANLSGSMTIEELAEWLISNEEYIEKLQNYEIQMGEEGNDEEGKDEEVYITYRDQETGIEVSDSDLWLEAVWTDDKPITLNANGGKINNASTMILGVMEGKEYGAGLDIVPTRQGYVFAGWYTKENIQKTSEDIYYSADLIDGTLYAQWEKEDSARIITIKYNANGGSCATSTERKVQGTKIGSLPNATRNNYAFLGWYTSASGGNKITANTVVTNNITVYAQWGNQLKMYYDLQGGEWRNSSKYKKMSFANDTVYMGTTINFKMPARSSTSKTKLSIKARTGYKFRGWYTRPNGAGDNVTKGYRITQTSNFTIYAYWEKKCTITYNANGGVFNKKTGVTTKTKEKYAEAKYPTISKPTRAGYTFEGWYDAPEGGNKILLNNNSYKVQKDITLYAHWIDKIKPQKFTVAVNGLTAEGFAINLSKQVDLGSGVGEIKYYVNDSKTGNVYQVDNMVTGLEDATTKYVWAEITDKAGNTRKSTNYIKVTTAHVHDTTSCYSTTSKVYVERYMTGQGMSTYNTYCSTMYCPTCNKTIRGTGSIVRFWRMVTYMGKYNKYRDIMDMLMGF